VTFGAREEMGSTPGHEVIEVDEAVLDSGGRRFWRRFFHTRTAVVALAFLVLVVFCAVFAPLIARHSPYDTQFASNLGPTKVNWLGTDADGRDIFARLLYGARVSLEASFMIVGLAMIVAVPLGLFAGYFSGWRDSIVMRGMDALFAFPPLILALAVASLLGKSLFNESVAIAIVFVPGFVRLIRGQVVTIRGETYMEASRSVGASDSRMVSRHVFPNVASPMIVQVALALGFALLAEAGLSFLGLGVQPPQASWGGMLSDAYQSMLSSQWQLVPPGAAIALTVLSFNLAADGLRDALGREHFQVDR
jgi:ABC-type dipeptide/oligopeptide/nickel transport system permease subunit